MTPPSPAARRPAAVAFIFVTVVLDVLALGIIIPVLPKLVENFKNAPIPIRQVPAGDTEAVIAEFDKIWLPKAPVLAELRKVGATL